MPDGIHVPLELEGFEVIASAVIDGHLEVSVSSTRPLVCHHCNSAAVVGHSRESRLIRDRACGHPTVLRWLQRRVKCRDCGRTSRERHPQIAGRKAVTNRFRRQLFERSIAQPFTHVAALEGVSTYRVLDAFEAHAARTIVETEPQEPRVLSVDESAFRKRLRFHAVFSDPERGAVLDLVEGRGEAAVKAGLLGLNPQVRATIETVVIDCFWPFRRAVEDILPDARIVADKFHILRAMDQAAQRVRRRFGRMRRSERLGRGGRMAPRQVRPANDPNIYRARWVFMKRASKLTDSEHRWLEEVFDLAGPELRCAWLLKESFAAIYDAADRGDAEHRLDVWIHNMRCSGVKEFAATWGLLQPWREPMLAYFDDPFTNAFAEGITNKIKVMKRMAYGFRNSRRYRLKVLLACGPRRRWEGSTHRYSR